MLRLTRRLLPLLLGLVFLLPASSADRTAEPALDPDQPYGGRKSNPVTYEVDYAVVVTAPYGTKVLKVWLPLPPSDTIQQVESQLVMRNYEGFMKKGRIRGRRG